MAVCALMHTVTGLSKTGCIRTTVFHARLWLTLISRPVAGLMG